MDYKDDYSKKDLDEIEKLIQIAKDSHLWFYHILTDEWFSPYEIETKIRKKYLFALSTFWTLKDPFLKIDAMIHEKTELNEKIINMRSKIERWGNK